MKKKEHKTKHLPYHVIIFRMFVPMLNSVYFGHWWNWGPEKELFLPHGLTLNPEHQPPKRWERPRKVLNPPVDGPWRSHCTCQAAKTRRTKDSRPTWSFEGTSFNQERGAIQNLERACYFYRSVTSGWTGHEILIFNSPLPRLDPLEVKDRPAHLGPADALESKSRSDMVKIAELPHPVAFEFSLPRVRSLVLQRTRTCCRAVLSQRGWLQLCYICYIASLCRLEVKHC